jgi:MFS family permease
MIVISLGVGGIGLAGGFEELYICRLLTGLGVAGLSTAATMTMTGTHKQTTRAYGVVVCHLVCTNDPVHSPIAVFTLYFPTL